VVTHGRSGSTLLQGILNAIPGYVIRGENGGVLLHMQAIVTSLERDQGRFRPISRAPTDPWYGLDVVDTRRLRGELSDVFVRDVLRPPEGTRCVGFKEIRYGPDRVRDLPALLDFMDVTFPRACFVFNVRDIDAAASSGFFAGRRDARGYLERFQEQLADAYGQRTHNAVWLRYDDYANDPSALAPLFDFLGEPFDLGSVTATMQVLHSTRTARPESESESESQPESE
jgi:hypothetical protein